MSTEYDRNVHADKSTEEVASGSQVGEPSTWQESRDPVENDTATTESPDDATAVEYGVPKDETEDHGAAAYDTEEDRAAVVSEPVPDTESAEVSAVPDGDDSTAAATDNAVAQQQTSLDDVGAPLFAEAELDRLSTQWREVQGNFVDNPRDAVTQADKIVADIIYQLTTGYAERKRVLEQHCAGLQDGDTEELRQALRGYRGFFRRLLVIES